MWEMIHRNGSRRIEQLEPHRSRMRPRFSLRGADSQRREIAPCFIPLSFPKLPHEYAKPMGFPPLHLFS
ncbi:hypothetical protein EYF80_005904 [Liparis tanakae]|uniref:Uncharacterized protein n=1 Tax=Liparis tanakae TaxID=230148 RepID=A0A4Z2J1Z3_9TELE|nr:hypothetical protein EYF80_005904 [Liparis tanakae]